jgi:hypothetical protein
MTTRVNLVDHRGAPILADPLDVDPVALAAGAELRTLRRDATGQLREVIIKLDEGDDDMAAFAHRSFDEPMLNFTTHFLETKGAGIKPPAKAASAKTPLGGIIVPTAPQAPDTPSRRVTSPKRASINVTARERAAQEAAPNGAVALFEEAAKMRPPADTDRAEHQLHSYRTLKVAMREQRPRDYAPPGMQRAAAVDFVGHAGTQKIIIMGGCGANPSVPSREVYSYNLGTQQWHRVEGRGTLPRGRHSHAATIARGAAEPQHIVYVHGGVAVGGHRNPLPLGSSDDHRAARQLLLMGESADDGRGGTSGQSTITRSINPEELLSRRTTTVTTALSMHQVHTAPLSVLEVRGPVGISDELFAYHPATHEWRQLPTEPAIARAAHTLTCDGRGGVYMIGGVNVDLALASMEVLVMGVDVACDKCRKGNGAIRCTGCQRHLCQGCATQAEHALVHGGQMSFRAPRYRFERASFPDDATSSAPDATSPSKDATPRARYYHSATWHDASQTIITFGGLDEAQETLNDLQCFVPRLGRWQRMATDSSLMPRYGHSAAIVDSNRLLLVGGHGEDSGSFVATVTEVNLVPQRGFFVHREVRLSGDHIPRFSFAAIGAAGDNSSVVLYGGFGRPKMVKQPAMQERDFNQVGSMAKLTAVPSSADLQSSSSPKSNPLYELKPRNWTMVLAFPLKKVKKDGAPSDHSGSDTNSVGSAADDHKEREETPPRLKAFLKRVSDRQRHAADSYEAEQKLITLKATEDADAKLWLPKSKIDWLYDVFAASIRVLDKFNKGAIPNVPNKAALEKLFDDSLTVMRQGREVVAKMRHPKTPTPFRQAVILDHVTTALTNLRQVKELQKGWQLQGEAKVWEGELNEFHEGASEAVKSADKAVREIQREITTKSMARLQSGADKLMERRRTNVANVQKLREETIKRDPYAPTKRATASKQKQTEEAKEKETARREELAKTKRGRRVLDAEARRRKEQRERLRSMSGKRGPARVAVVTVTDRDAAAVKRLRIAARDATEDLLDILVPPAVRKEEAAMAQAALNQPTTLSQLMGDAPPPAAPADAATQPPPTQPPPPAVAPVGPEAAKVLSLEARRAAADKVTEAMKAFEAFDAWYVKLAMETLAAKKKAAKQQQPPAGSAAASGAASETDDDKPQPGTIRSDRLEPLEAASAAGHAMVAAVKAVRLKSDDPARPALEPLKPAVACAEDLGKIFRSAEQYVRLTFLSAGADAADRPGSPPPPTSGVNPTGGPFTFRPTINPAPKRPSSAAPVRSTVHAAVTVATAPQLASIASLPLPVPLGGESAPFHHTVAELGNLRHVRPLTAPLLVPVPTRPAPDPAADMLTTATFGWGGAPYGQPQQAPFVYHYPVAPLGMPTAAEPRTGAALPPAPSCLRGPRGVHAPRVGR